MKIASSNNTATRPSLDGTQGDERATGGAAPKLRVLDLFSGIGGFSLGLERTGGFETVAFCEADLFCVDVLKKHWPQVPVYDDVRTLSTIDLLQDGVEPIDVICGGFPCQDVSASGPKVGLAGSKSSLWRQFARLIRELRPQYVIVENVAGLLYRGLGEVLGDLASSGYDAEWHCIPASVVGLPQTRDRVWIVAYPCEGRQQAGDERIAPRSRPILGRYDDRLGEAQARADACASRPGGRDDGLPDWVDRVAALGNSLVPQIPELIGRAILQARSAQ